MIGWMIVIAALTTEERDAPLRYSKAAVLAKWEVSLGGIHWLNKLIEDGKATQLTAGGYPNRYTALASAVLPLLTKGIPSHKDVAILGDDYVMPAGWIGDLSMDLEKIAACPGDQLLTIEAWDLS